MATDADKQARQVTLRDSLPLLVVHVGCLGALGCGFSASAGVVMAATYAARVFALTAGFHRYFSHKSYRTSRFLQFVLAVVGTSAAQLGPLWWAAHHRWHHRYADTGADIHSPTRHGFWWAHIGWLLCRGHAATRMDLVRDFARYPELRFLNRHPYLPPLALAVGLFAAGEWAARARPAWGATGLQWLVWGFFVSTVLVYHATFCINSLMHLWGTRRFATSDTSRNNLVLALLTMGEGWHNNHHRYPICARQGFRWWEIDLSYYGIRLLDAFGLVWDIREPPKEIRTAT